MLWIPTVAKETTGLNKFLQGIGALAAVYTAGHQRYQELLLAESEPLSMSFGIRQLLISLL